MKKLLKTATLAVALVGFQLCEAQKINVSWSEISKIETQFKTMVNGNQGEIIKLSYQYEGGGLFGKKQTVTPILTKYDTRFKELASKSYTSSEEGSRVSGIIKAKDYIYLMTNKYDKEAKSTSYFAQAININTLNTEGSIKNFGSFSASGGGLFSSVEESSVRFLQSQDSSKILVFALTPYNKRENEKYYIGVYDSKLNKLWDRTVELPYLDKFVELYDYFVTNEGNVGVIFKHYDQEVKKESTRKDGERVPAYTTKLILYTDAKTQTPEMAFDVNKKFIHAITLTNEGSSNFSMFGLYKTKETGKITGYFTCTIDTKSSQIGVKKMEDFPTDLVEQLDKDDQGSKKEKDPGFAPYFRLEKVLVRDNGSHDYIIQYYKKVIRESTSSSSSGFSGVSITRTRTYIDYYYGNIIDINISTAGKATFTRIPKFQASTDFNAASNFLATTLNNKLFVFFNDDKDNVDREMTRKPDACTRFGNSVLVMATVDEKGQFAREIIFSNKDLPVTTCINESRIVAKNRLCLYARKIDAFSGSKDMFGLLEIK